MKRILLTLLILTGCAKDYSIDNTDSLIPDLQVEGDIGLSFYNSTITDTDLFNIKSPISTTYTLEVKDVFNNLITKSTLKAKEGNNIELWNKHAKIINSDIKTFLS